MIFLSSYFDHIWAIPQYAKKLILKRNVILNNIKVKDIKKITLF